MHVCRQRRLFVCFNIERNLLQHFCWKVWSKHIANRYKLFGYWNVYRLYVYDMKMNKYRQSLELRLNSLVKLEYLFNNKFADLSELKKSILFM